MEKLRVFQHSYKIIQKKVQILKLPTKRIRIENKIKNRLAHSYDN